MGRGEGSLKNREVSNAGGEKGRKSVMVVSSSRGIKTQHPRKGNRTPWRWWAPTRKSSFYQKTLLGSKDMSAWGGEGDLWKNGQVTFNERSQRTRGKEALKKV